MPTISLTAVISGQGMVVSRSRGVLSTVVVDLDSTLADTSHRHAFTPLSDPRYTWVDYSLLSIDDKPVPGAVRLVQLLYEHYQIHILSFREDAATEMTMHWLVRHNIPYDRLQLKPAGMPDDNHNRYKIEAVKQLQEQGESVELVIDDWPGLREAMWEAVGVPVLVVNPCYPASYADKAIR